MTKSPCSCYLPTALSSYRISAGQNEPGLAAQGSCALMGDSRPNSFVFCHAHGAQILEIGGWPSLDASVKRFGGGEEKAGSEFDLPAM